MRVTRQLTSAVGVNIHRLDHLKEDISYYLPSVQEEIKQINTIRQKEESNWHIQRCLLFALASPMNRFESNIIAARRVHERLDSLNTVDDVYKALSEDGTATIASGNAAKAIFNSLSFIKSLHVVGYMGEYLRSKNGDELFGAGPKVTAMAAHLWNPYDQVFTLDTHMLRLILNQTLGISGKWEIKIPEYYELESKLLEWGDTFGQKDLSPFALQWAMWCVQRKEFVSHVGIFG